jgi:hypothetical protein
VAFVAAAIGAECSDDVVELITDPRVVALAPASLGTPSLAYGDVTAWAKILAARGSADLAIQLLEDALIVDSNVHVRNALNVTLYTAARYSSPDSRKPPAHTRIQYLERLIELGRNEPYMYKFLAEAHLDAGDIELARSYLGTALDRDPALLGAVRICKALGQERPKGRRDNGDVRGTSVRREPPTKVSGSDIDDIVCETGLRVSDFDKMDPDNVIVDSRVNASWLGVKVVPDKLLANGYCYRKLRGKARKAWVAKIKVSVAMLVDGGIWLRASEVLTKKFHGHIRHGGWHYIAKASLTLEIAVFVARTWEQQGYMVRMPTHKKLTAESAHESEASHLARRIRVRKMQLVSMVLHACIFEAEKIAAANNDEADHASEKLCHQLEICMAAVRAAGDVDAAQERMNIVVHAPLVGSSPAMNIVRGIRFVLGEQTMSRLSESSEYIEAVNQAIELACNAADGVSGTFEPDKRESIPYRDASWSRFEGYLRGYTRKLLSARSSVEKWCLAVHQRRRQGMRR